MTEEQLQKQVESREHIVRRLSQDRRLDKFIPLRVDQLLDEALSTFPHDTEEDTIVRVETRLEREDAEINPVKLPRLGPDAMADYEMRLGWEWKILVLEYLKQEAGGHNALGERTDRFVRGVKYLLDD